MPYYLIHAGTALQKLATDGVLSSLTLPSGVTVSSARRARFAILDRWVIVVNAVSRNIFMDAATLQTRLLNIAGPSAKLTSAAGAAGNPNGEYRYKFTYAIMSGTDVLVESPFSAESTPITLTNLKGALSDITVSPTTSVNARRIYRTTNGSSTYYLLATIADNTTTTYTDDSTDYDLALLGEVEPRGNAPGVDGTDRLQVITTWKDRLWATSANEPDRIRFTANREIYAWPSNYSFNAKPIGEDEIGVTAFVPRRNELLVGKRSRILKIIGDGVDSFEILGVTEGIGPISQEATVVVRDVPYFLGEDGFYQYGGSGLVSLTRDRVHPWFTTDDYFNRALFSEAFAKWNPKYDVIDLHLAAAGSTSIDRWVSLDLRTGRWYGPHKTDAFTPTMATLGRDDDDLLVPIVGASSGHIYTGNRATRSDDATAIAFALSTKFHGANTPDIEKFWGELAVLSDKLSTGSVTVTPYFDDPDAPTAGTALTHALTSGRERLGRVGTGRLCQLRFTESNAGQSVLIYGYELPFHELGRR